MGYNNDKLYMPKIICITLLINLSFINCLFPRLSYANKELSKFKINLDLSVRERYTEILKFYKDKIQVYAYVTSSLYPINYLVSKIPENLINTKYQDPEWIDYVKLVSEIAEISLSDAFMLSVTYDMGCTSTVIQNAKNNIFMGRNLDFTTYFVISHLMFEVEYYRNGVLHYTGIELAGFRGAINAVKKGKFSASINLRRDSSQYRINNLYRIYSGLMSPNFNLMKVMDKAESFEEAVEMLSHNKLSSSVFYVVSGVKKNEGAVISRNHDSIHRIDRLDVDNGIWFLVICNTDYEKEESITDTRRAPAEKNIEKIGRDNINYENLFNNVMSIYPSNNLITSYTTIQNAKGYFNTTLWLP